MHGIRCHCGHLLSGVNERLPSLNSPAWMRMWMWTVWNSAVGHGDYEIRQVRDRRTKSYIKSTGTAEQLSCVPIHCPHLWIREYIDIWEYAKNKGRSQFMSQATAFKCQIFFSRGACSSGSLHPAPSFFVLPEWWKGLCPGSSGYRL